MEVTTSIREEDSKTQVTVVASADEVQEYIDAQFKKMRKARIPGFRPGRAPRPVLEQNFGGHEAVFAEITTELINGLAPKAVDSQDILFINNPDFEETPNVVEGEGYTFTLYGKVKPEVELLTYDPVEIKMPSEEVTEEEIDAQIAQLASYYYNFEDVEGRAVEAGDYVSIDLACTANGEEVQGLNSEDRLIELGQGIMPESFEEQVIGMSTGDSKSFDFSVEGASEYEYLGVDAIHAEVTLKAIRTKINPEITDDFAKMVGFDSVADLRTKFEEAISKQKGEQLPALKESRCTEALAERVHGEVPQAYVNFTRQDILRDFYNNLQRQGVTFDEFLAQQHITADAFQQDLEQEAREVATQTLALDALYRERGFEITEEDIAHEFTVVDNPEATRKEWEEAGRMSEIREAVRRRKATEWLLETAVVTEDTGDGDEDEED